MRRFDSLDTEARRLLAVWNALAPPLRPSSNDIELFAQGWKNWEGARILIQGVTPELVDLALRKNAARVIAMDWSRSSFLALKQLGREDWSSVENMVNDWRVFVPALEESVEVVLGDGTLTMLDFPEEWESVLKNFRQYLLPGSRIILRLPFQPEGPFDIDSHMRKIMSDFDARYARADSDRRREMLQALVSEVRIAFGIASAGSNGTVDPVRRAEMVHLFHNDFAARYGHLKEWEFARVGMPSEADVWKERRAGKSFPQWKDSAGLVEACGFRIKRVEWSGTRPAPSAMRLFVAERQ